MGFFLGQTEPANIPDIGVNVAEFVGTGISTLGAVAAVAVGGYAAFLIVKRGLRWMGWALR